MCKTVSDRIFLTKYWYTNDKCKDNLISMNTEVLNDTQSVQKTIPEGIGMTEGLSEGCPSPEPQSVQLNGV